MWSWLLAVMLVACGGASSRDVETAKTAHYNATPQALLEIAMKVASRNYQISDVDAQGRFAIGMQIFHSNGVRMQSREALRGEWPDDAIGLAFIVEVHTRGRGTTVVITPMSFHPRPGNPTPEQRIDDPNLPEWARGRADELAVAIYDAAKQHAVRLP